MSIRNSNLIFLTVLSFTFGNTIIHDYPNQIDQKSSYVVEAYYEKSTAQARDGYLYYKSSSQTQYIQTLMKYEDGKYVSTILSNQIPDNSIDYFISFNLDDSSFITYPQIAPMENPISISVKSIDDFSIISEVDESGIEVVLPKSNETVHCNGFFICVSLENAYGIDKNSVRLFIDGRELEIENKADTFRDFIITKRISIVDGIHKAELTYNDSYGNEKVPLRWTFYATKDRVEKGLIARSASTNGHLYTTLSSISDSSLNINAQLGLRYNIDLDWMSLRLDYRGSMNSKKYDNDKDSYLIELENRFLTFGIGGFYPKINQFILAGEKVSGYNLSLKKGPIVFDFVSGKLQKAIQGHGSDELYGMVIMDSDIILNSTGGTNFEISRIGYEFQRDIISSRIGLRYKNKFNLISHITKIKDADLTIDKSIDGGYINLSDNLIDEIGIHSSDLINLEGVYESYILASKFSEYIAENDSIIYRDSYWPGSKPKDNLVVGGLLKFNFFKRITFQSSIDYSLYNNNIWDTRFSSSDNLDTLAILNDSLLDDKILDQNIILDPNNLSNLFDFGLSQQPIAPFTFRSSIIDLLIDYRYKKMNMNFLYRYNGPEFRSLANKYIEVGYSMLGIDYNKGFFDNAIRIGLSFYDKNNIAYSDTTDIYDTMKIGSDILIDFGPVLPSMFLEFNYYSMNNHLSKSCVDSNPIEYQSVDMNSTEFRFNINNKFSFIGQQILNINGYSYDRTDKVGSYFEQYSSACDFSYSPRDYSNRGYNIQLLTNYLRWNIESGVLSQFYTYGIEGKDSYLASKQARASLVVGYNMRNVVKNLSIGYDFGIVSSEDEKYNIHMVKSSILANLPLEFDLNLSYSYYLNLNVQSINYSNLLIRIRRKF